jgi:hypothetical protein
MINTVIYISCGKILRELWSHFLFFLDMRYKVYKVHTVLVVVEQQLLWGMMRDVLFVLSIKTVTV